MVDITDGFPDLYEVSISKLRNGLEKRRFTSVDLVKAYLARINEVNLKGPALRAVIEDNIATAHSEGLNTTAGSLALLGSVIPRDTHVMSRLCAAGALVLGKANLCEWSHSRGKMPPGWSARGGQGLSPYVPLGDPSGSSSGSAVGTAIGLAAAALGTDTHGSIIMPGGTNNVVGLKPTVGLTSRAGVIPSAVHQDTVGVIARSVADTVAFLSVIAGPDPRDDFTLAQPPVLPDYTKALRTDGLKGARLGIPRKYLAATDSVIVAAFNAVLDTFRSLGATVVDNTDFLNFEELRASRHEGIVMNTGLKVGIGKYIGELLEVPTGVKSLADIIAFNVAHADQELPSPFWTDQSKLIAAEETTEDQTYLNALATNKDLGATRGIDATLKQFNLDTLILPSAIDFKPAAIAGYPAITIPLGFFPPDMPLVPAEPTRAGGPNQPFGLMFVGTAFSEPALISFAYAFEQAMHTRLKQRAFQEAIPRTQLSDVVGK